ncbi:MAG: cytochrome c biogenesis CcdA family protein [Dermatophilus congolensis]|nr:cytochrome c biogenesis CcdA family protein [Dermatophilus congolensis]
MTGLTIPIALVAGILSFASPCFLPVVPVFVAYLLGDQAPQGKVTREQRLTAASHAFVFVVGFSAVFVTLWASIGLIGYAIGDYRNTLRIVGGALLIVMGLHVAGLIEIPFLQRQKSISLQSVVAASGGGAGRGSGGQTAAAGGSSSGAATATKERAAAPPPPSQLAPSYRRSVLLGLAFGAGWTPCIGPILGGVIGLASVGDSVAQGTVLLLAFCLGLGIPFVLVAVGATDVARHLGKLRNHQAIVSFVAGSFLILTGFLMITDLFGRFTGLLPVPPGV